MSSKKDNKKKITEICDELQSNIDLSKGVTNASLIHAGDDDYFFMNVHHLAVDGVSWRVISSDLELAYNQLLRGEEVKLPGKTHTYNDYAEALKAYRNSYKLEQEIAYWEKVQEKLLKLPTSNEKDYSRSFGKLTARLDLEGSKRFTGAKFTAINGDINDALLTAVCRSYKKTFGDDSVSIQFEGHGREDIGQELVIDRTVGWFTSVYPVVVEHISGDIAKDLLNVKETMHRVPNKGVGYNVLRFIEGTHKVALANDRIARIGFNYLGEIDSEQQNDAFFGSSDISTGESVSKKNVFGTDIAINCIVSNGRFELMLDYNTALFTEDKAQGFVNGILEQLQEIAAYLSTLKEQVVTATDLGENEWSMEEFDRITAEFASRGETVTRIYPLTPMQEGMLLKHISEPNSWAYRLVSVFEMDKLPTEEQLERALSRLAKKHEVLRTSIIHEGVDVPRQAIVERRLGLKLLDFTNETDPEVSVRTYREEVMTNGYDLQRKPLFQLTCIKKSPASCYLVVATHHAIVDGWCIGLYLGDLFKYINEELTGSLSQDAEPEKGAYEAAVREILQKDKNAGLKYWQALLEGYDTRAEIPSFGEVPKAEQSEADSLTSYVGADITEKLTRLCKEEQATFSNVLELAWGLMLQTYSRSSDAVFAKVVSGRDNTKTDVNNVVGLFINSVPVRVRSDKNSTGRQLLKQLQQQAVDSNIYDFCSLAEIQQQTELGSQLFQSVMAFENYDSGDQEPGQETADAMTFTVRNVVMKEESFDELSCAMYIAEDNRTALRISFDRTRYRLSDIERAAELFGVLLTGIANNPDMAVSSLPKITEAKRAEVLALSAGPRLEFNTSETWLNMFEYWAEAQPGHIAVVDKSSSYTYAELETAANRIAHYLVANGVRANDFVAIKLGRIKEYVAAFMGIQKAGAAFVPVDMEYPPDRIEYILENSQAKYILDEAKLKEIISSDISTEYIDNSKPENRAYMIYTSGSTGRPKGVILHQRGLLNFTKGIMSMFELTNEDRISAHRSFSFDAHIGDFYPTLSAGATVYIMPEDIRKDLDQIYSFLIANEITGGGYTTSIAKLLLTNYDLKQRFISCGGEALRGVRNDKVQIFNLYGPTECTNDIVVGKLEKGRYYEAAPVGRPMINSYCFIVDKYNNLVPQGVKGEICYAGPQVGYGYCNLPDKTAEVFEDCPFVEGLRMYHTGDIGYYDAEGEINYIGRIDFQVKLNGFRIELGEIEGKALQFEHIKQVSAQVRQSQLCLYYTVSAEVDETALQAYLSASLAAYMIPNVYMQLERMPMTPNGKIDRKALPDIQCHFALENEPPENPNEFMALMAAKEVLPGIKFGVTDDLIKLGMTSLKSMRMITKINSQLDMRIKFQEIERFRTIRNILLGTRRISWLYKKYDPAKPVLVLPHGIIEPIHAVGLKSTLSRFFNLMVIEPFYAHYDALFDGDYFDDVAELYTMQVGMLLPSDARVAGFIGFSFGGELAFEMAYRWYKATGELAPVIVGDTYFHEDGDTPMEQIQLEKFEEVRDNYYKLNPDYTDDEIRLVIKIRNSINLIVRRMQHNKYKGKTLYLNAFKQCDEAVTRNKLEAVQKYAEDLKVYDFGNMTHTDIYENPAMFPFFEELAIRLLKK